MTDQDYGSDLERRVSDLETRVAYLIRQLGIEYPEPGEAGSYPDVLALARQGRKIDAVKLYRERTGAGLKDAKEAVEAMEESG